MKKSILKLLMIVTTLAPLSTIGLAHADDLSKDDIALLKSELAAQKFLNMQLKKKLAKYEEVEELKSTVLPTDDNIVFENNQLYATDVDVIAENTAIAESLVTKGVSLLPNGRYRVSPFFSWIHTGSGAQQRDNYSTGLTFEAGLPWEMSASIRVPYVYRDFDSANNKGLGDISVSLSKTLLNETPQLPSLVTRFTYIDDNGKDAFDAVPVGSGFKSYELSLSAVKRFSPLVVYGTFGYQHVASSRARLKNNLDQIVFKGSINPGEAVNTSAGISLVATPTIALDAGLNYSFIDRTTLKNNLNGVSATGSRQTLGFITLGSNFLINKNLSLQLTAGAGITDDSPDSLLFINLPYRF